MNKVLKFLAVSVLAFAGFWCCDHGTCFGRERSPGSPPALCGATNLHEKQVRLFQAYGKPGRLPDQVLAAQGRLDAKGKPSRAQVGASQVFWAYDFMTNFDYQLNATLQKLGRHCAIYVEQGWNVSPQVLDQIASEFDTAIYGPVTRIFGKEADVDGDPRITILLLDILDGFNGTGGYIAGYYYGLDEYALPASNHREMVYLDINPAQPGTLRFNSTLAHEFQHLVHFNQDGLEETWVDEGCATLAQVLCGYGLDEGMVREFLSHPDNSLPVWGGEFSDYGQGMLFFYYLWEKYGGDALIGQLTKNHLQGMGGINATLKGRGYTDTFYTAFLNWVVANYLDNPDIEGGKYGYRGVDLPRTSSSPVSLSASWFFNPVTSSGYVQPFGADYIKFNNGTNVTVSFSGNDLDSFQVLLIDESGPTPRISTIPLNAANEGSSAFFSSYPSLVMIPVNLLAYGNGEYHYTTRPPAAAASTHSYYVPYFKDGGGAWTGVALSNGSATHPATAQMTIYNQSGNLIGTETRSVPARGTSAFVAGAGLNQEGWMVVGSNQPLSGVCLAGAGGALNCMADIPLTSTAATGLIIPHVTQDNLYDTTIVVCNPHDSDTGLFLTYVAESGSAYQPSVYTLESWGSVMVPLGQLIHSGVAPGGKIEISADKTVVGFALYDDFKSGGRSFAGLSAAEGAGGAWAALAADRAVPAAESKPLPAEIAACYEKGGRTLSGSSYHYYVPYFRDGNGYATGLGVSNESFGAGATVNTTVYNLMGGVIGTATGTVAAGGAQMFEVGTGSGKEGWMLVSSSQPLNGLSLVGTSGLNSYLADIPLDATAGTLLVVPHVTQTSTYDTTIMLSNPNQIAVSASLTYVAPNGQAFPAAEYALPALGGIKVGLAALLGGAAAAGGKVEIAATEPITGFVLYDNLKTGGRSYAGISAAVGGNPAVADIIPGQRMAGIDVGASYASVVALYGQPDVTEYDFYDFVTRCYYHRRGIGVTIDDSNLDSRPNADEWVLMVMATAPYNGKTSGGSGINSTMMYVLNEFGSAEYYDPTIKDYWYQSRGIVFTAPWSFVYRIGVFAPVLWNGSAARAEGGTPAPQQ